MLVRITDCCTMGCTHCMTESHPGGGHMSLDTFRQVLEFSRLDLPVLLISGGEPTEHPQLVQMLKMAKFAGYTTALLSNGEFFSKKPKLAKRIKPLVHAVQVTNDPRFYPRRVKLPKSQACETLRIVAPFGRARKAGLDCTRMSPYCFNLRSATRYYGTVYAAIACLRGKSKMCSPSVNTDGTVVAGEAPECTSIGTVQSTPEALTDALVNLTCNHCGLMDSLAPEQREAVGERWANAVYERGNV